MPLNLLQQAQQGAALADTDARVTRTGHARCSVSLWDESRICHPGD